MDVSKRWSRRHHAAFRLVHRRSAARSLRYLLNQGQTTIPLTLYSFTLYLSSPHPPSFTMAFGKDAAAALVFLILYFAMFCYMAFMYATKRLKWASRFTILFAHCIIRLASQVSHPTALLRHTEHGTPP